MRRPQHTLTAAAVRHLSSQLLAPLLGVWPVVRTCTLDVVLAVLSYAAARITSVTDACARLTHAPDSDTVLAHLATQVRDLPTLDRRLRAVLAASLSRALRRGRWVVAIDTTLVPYYGQPFASPAEVFRSQPKHGTTHFHCYATAVVVRHGLRFTLAVLPVPNRTPMAEVVRQVRRRVVAAGVHPRLLLLDRGFNNAGVVRYLQAARQPFVMPQAIHCKAPKSGVLTGLRGIRATHPTGWTRYSWNPDGRRVSVDLCVLRRRRVDRRGHRTFLYACWGVRRRPADVYRVDRTRFGVETSDRLMNQVRIGTTTRNPALRLLCVAVALLLRNLWVWLHWCALAEPRRGERRPQLERLRLRVMAILPFLLPAVAAMVRVQLLTGMRPGEVCRLRPCDLDASGTVWVFRQPQHKTRHRGKERAVAIGPKAQQVLAAFAPADPTDYVFSPGRAVADAHSRRTAARRTLKFPSHMARNAAKRMATPHRPPAVACTVTSYGKAVRRAVGWAR